MLLTHDDTGGPFSDGERFGRPIMPPRLLTSPRYVPATQAPDDYSAPQKRHLPGGSIMSHDDQLMLSTFGHR